MIKYILLLFIVIMVVSSTLRKTKKKKNNQNKKTKNRMTGRKVNTKNNNKKVKRTKKGGMSSMNNTTKLGDKMNSDERNDALINKCNNYILENNDKCNIFNEEGNPVKYTDYQKKRKDEKNNKGCDNYHLCRDYISSFMSGDEPEYDPKSWSDPSIEGSHNCYAYFLDDKIPRIQKKCKKICKDKNRNNQHCVKKENKCRKLKPQPGAWASRNNSFASLINSNNVEKIKNEDNNYLCPVMKEKIILDNLSKDGKPLVTPTPFDKKCDNGFYKGFLTLDSGISQKMPKGHTYHFFRQDNSGFWSHKPGTLPVENIDADNKPIVAPHLAEKNYNKDKKSDGINYDVNCSYFCIPHNKYGKTQAN